MQPERGLEKKADAARKAAHGSICLRPRRPARSNWPSEAGLELTPKPMRGPETGLVTVRGRIGGDGAVVQHRRSDGDAGHGAACHAGRSAMPSLSARDKEKVRIAAILDAHWCTERHPTDGRGSGDRAAGGTGRPGRRPAAGRDRRDQGRLLHHGAGRRLMVLAEHIIGRFCRSGVQRAGGVSRRDGCHGAARQHSTPARPGTAASPLSASAAAVALTLCDQDTPVWLDAALRDSRNRRELARLSYRRAVGQHAFRRAFRSGLRPGRA